jgi:NADH dehydrogenase/NADH:ubiquinone oxidoreductase subunit G
MFALKDLMTRLGSKNLDSGQDGAAFNPGWGRATYLFNATIAGIERADALLIIGSNPRREAAVLNARIRKRWRAGKFPVALIGEKVDLTYPYDYLGAGPDTLTELVAGKHSFAETLKKAEHPLIIVGAGALTRPDGAAVAALAAKAAIEMGAVKEGWNGYSVLHTAASRVGALELGFVPGEGGLNAAAMSEPGALDVAFLLGADEIDVPTGAFVVYIGTHGDNGAHRADVILPGAAYPEKSGLYVNTEGRVQLSNRASLPRVTTVLTMPGCSGRSVKSKSIEAILLSTELWNLPATAEIAFATSFRDISSLVRARSRQWKKSCCSVMPKSTSAGIWVIQSMKPGLKSSRKATGSWSFGTVAMKRLLKSMLSNSTRRRERSSTGKRCSRG